jgi:hypothetical protein
MSLLRGMSAILRERVAFEKASDEIRKAETFAAKTTALRSVESSKLAKENADLRFELEEAYDAIERQKQVTESVARELAEIKAQYETSQMAFQTLGSPLANGNSEYEKKKKKKKNVHFCLLFSFSCLYYFLHSFSSTRKKVFELKQKRLKRLKQKN